MGTVLGVAFLLIAAAASDAPPRLDVDALQRACDGGDGASCAKLAAAFEAGVGVPHKNIARARLLYEAACADGVAASCTDAGVAHETGALAASVDPEAALDAYVKGCDGGDVDSCMRAASYEAIAKLPEAKAHFQKACSLGDLHGCIGYASLIRVEGPLEAARLYKKGCDASIQAACFALARLCASRDREVLDGGLAKAPECVADKQAKPTAPADGRAHGTAKKLGAFSVAVPPGVRAVDVEHDARKRPALARDVVNGRIAMVPLRDDVDDPNVTSFDASLNVPAAPDDAACAKVNLDVVRRNGPVFSARAVDTGLGKGCAYRIQRIGRTRTERHVLVVHETDQDALVVDVIGENEPASQILGALIASIRRDP